MVKEKALNYSSIKPENEYKGTGYLSHVEREYRKSLLTKGDIQLLIEMVENAFG